MNFLCMRGCWPTQYFILHVPAFDSDKCERDRGRLFYFLQGDLSPGYRRPFVQRRIVSVRDKSCNKISMSVKVRGTLTLHKYQYRYVSHTFLNGRRTGDVFFRVRRRPPLDWLFSLRVFQSGEGRCLETLPPARGLATFES